MDEAERVDIDQEKLLRFFEKFKKQAKDIVGDKNKLKDVIKKSKKRIHHLQNVPFIGAVIGDYIAMIDMLVAYAKGEYKNIPISTIISIVATLLYILSPVDLIPDCIPVIGFADDAMLINLVRKTLIGKDLDRFRKYRLLQETDQVRRWIDAFLGREDILDMYVQAIVISNKGCVKALISYENEMNTPIVCNMYECNITIEEYYSPEIQDDFINTFRKLFSECSIKTKIGYNFRIYDEIEFEKNETLYVIVENIVC